MNSRPRINKDVWETGLDPSNSDKRFDSHESFETSSGIPLERVYLPDDYSDHYLEQSGFPGEYPFTRGVHSNMYRGRLWTMRQYAGYASAAQTNDRFKFLMARGQTGVSVAFELPTQIGYDPDDPLVLGEVGKVGVSIATLDDMARLMDGISLAEISTSMTINAPAAILLAMYVVLSLIHI